MKSYLLICQLCSTSPPAEAQCTRSLEFDYKLRAVIPVAGQRTHGTTSRALTVTFRVATPGAESAVYDCIVQMSIGVFVVCTDASSSAAVRSGALCDERRRTRWAELLLRRRRTY